MATKKGQGSGKPGTPAPQRTLTLAKAGTTSYVITLAEFATPPERIAANELATHLKQITGAEFAIVTPSAATGRPVITVGPGAAKVVAPNLDLAKDGGKGLGDDGIVLKTVPPHLVLTGAEGAKRGTLYAVYEFLERECGMRWWSSKESYVPNRPVLSVPALNTVYVPKLHYREAFYFDACNGVHAARSRCNGHFEKIAPEYGGHYRILGFCHTFHQLLPPDKYFQAHPEWYSEFNGKRVSNGQLCLTNSEMRQELTRNALEWIRQKPEAGIISISMNDCLDGASQCACQCAACRAVDEREGTPSGLLIKFVNQVAAAIEKEYPGFLVETLAYVYTRKPPRITKPRSNVIVRLCSFECNFGEPLTHASNQAFRKDIEGWSKICKRLYVWDYVTNFSHFIQPHPNWYVLDDNIRFFVRNNVKGVFEQGNYLSPGGEMAELRAWMLAKLLWDPSRDGKALIQEFLKGYYGKAASHIAAYMRCIRESAVRTKFFVSLNTPATAAFLTPKVIMQSLRHLDAAEKTVVSNPEFLKRVRLLKLPCWYVVLVRWNSMEPIREHKLVPRDKKSLLRSFMGVCRENKITHASEVGVGRLQNFRTRCLDLNKNSRQSPFIATWRVSKLMPKNKGVSNAPLVTLANPAGWKAIEACYDFVDIHSLFQNADGIVYLATRLKTRHKGSWTLRVGHDGGVRVFIDGKAVITDSQCVNPAKPDRSKADITLNPGEHELVVALDTEHGKGWGIFARFEQHRKNHTAKTVPAFPECVLK